MVRNKNERRSSLIELVSEESASEEEKADLDYVAKNVRSRSKIPEFYLSIQQHMIALDGVQEKLGHKARIKSSGILSLWYSGVEAARESLPGNYKRTSVDDLVLEQVKVMNGLNADVRKAVRHSNSEALRLQKYGNHVMEEFETAKVCMQRTHVQYINTQSKGAALEEVLEEMRMENPDYSARKIEHDDVKRDLQRLVNRREVYAARVKFRIVERRDVLAKEETARTVLYELQKMGDYLAMFLENVEQTFNSTNLIQTAYQTAEALRDSFRVLSDIAQSRNIIAQGSAERMVAVSASTTYEFPESTLRQSLKQNKMLKPEARGLVFDEVNEMLSRPVMEPSFVPAANNGHMSNYAAQKDLLEAVQ